MAGEALFIGWGQVVRGREQLALQVFQESIAYYGELQQNRQIERFEPVLLEAHGGDLAGYAMLYGEQSALNSIRSSDQFLRLVSRANAVVDRIGVVTAHTGESLARLMGLFGEVAQELPQAR